MIVLIPRKTINTVNNPSKEKERYLSRFILSWLYMIKEAIVSAAIGNEYAHNER